MPQVRLMSSSPTQIAHRSGSVREYEYAPQQSFDFNGNWDGVSHDGQHTMIQFTIANNVLVTASCQGLGNATVSLSTAATNGDFSSDGPAGLSPIRQDRLCSRCHRDTRSAGLRQRHGLASLQGEHGKLTVDS